MKQEKRFFLCLLLSGLLLIIFVGRFNEKTNREQDYDGTLINGEIYQILNSEDIKKFIKENKINPLGVDTVYDFNTIIIFGDLYTHGYYEVYKKNDVVIKGRKIIGQGDWSECGPIMFSGGTASGDYPFAILYILDDELVNNNNFIEIVGERGSISKFNLIKSAYAIETRTIGRIEKYTVYDSNDEVLMSK